MWALSKLQKAGLFAGAAPVRDRCTSWLAMGLPPDRAQGAAPSLAWAAGRLVAAAQARYHRASLDGIVHLPDGPALLVANHGRFGLETPVFFYLLWQATGRAPVGLAERYLCALAPMRAILEDLGGVPGTRQNALALLRAGRLVVCYPGGAREVFKGAGERHSLAWEGKTGWLQVAREAQVPIVPVAAAGVDDTFHVVGRLGVLARLAGHEKYAVPVAVGAGLLPLPARFRFCIGPAVAPPAPEASEGALLSIHRRVRGWIEAQIARMDGDGTAAVPADARAEA